MFTQESLLSLIDGGESESVEFKETFDNEVLESIGAFANTMGGTVLIGVRDSGSVRGITLGKESLRDWTNQIAQATTLHPNILSLSHEDKSIVIIEVPESPLKPVPSRGRYFKRVGKSNRQMSDDDLTRAVLSKVGMTWDEVFEPRFFLFDLDPAQLRSFRTLCNQKGRRPIPASEDDATVLEKLGLLREGQLLRAAVLLFGKEPQRFYPQARVKIGRFRSETLIVDDREVLGTLFDQVEGTMGYFREHLQTRFEFIGEPSRSVIWEYPLEALREGITNAVCHRDYLVNAHTQVRVYDEFLRFMNPGRLPEPLTVDKLKTIHTSVVRNRKIAEMFFYTGHIEQWGSGTLKILTSLSQAGFPEPEFVDNPQGFWLTFRKDLLSEESLRAQGLMERQIRAVLLAKEKGSLTNREYRELTALSDEGARRDLNFLVSKGLLRREGKGRQARYVVPKVGD